MKKRIYKMTAVLMALAMILCDNSIISLAEEIVPEPEEVVYEEDLTDEVEEDLPEIVETRDVLYEEEVSSEEATEESESDAVEEDEISFEENNELISIETNNASSKPGFAVSPKAEGKMEINLLVAAIDPTLTSINGRNYHNGKDTIKASEYFGYSLSDRVGFWCENFEEVSHQTIDFNIVDTVEIDEFPQYKADAKLNFGEEELKELIKEELRKKLNFGEEELEELVNDKEELNKLLEADDELKKRIEDKLKMKPLDNNSFQQIFGMDDNGYGMWFTGIDSKEYKKYDSSGNLDYNYYINKLDLVDRRNAGEFDLVLLMGIDPLSPYETCMVGRKSFWVNGAGFTADCDNFVIVTPTFSRPDGSIENVGHLAEHMLGYSYGMISYDDKHSIDGTNYDALNDWQKFCLCKEMATVDTEIYGYGMVHYSPNSVIRNDKDYADYDWNNDDPVNYYRDWQNGKEIESFTASKCYLDDSFFNRYSNNCIAHHRWWFYNMPYEDGRDEDGYFNNWWRYIFTPDYVTGLSYGEKYPDGNINIKVGEEASIDFEVDYYSGKKVLTDAAASDASIVQKANSIFEINDGKLIARSAGREEIEVRIDGKVLKYTAVALENEFSDCIDSGKSNDISWKIDSTGKLFVSGSGDWERDFTSSFKYYGVSPWYKYYDEITSAEVDLTSPTDLSNMFYYCRNLKEVTLNINTSNVTNMCGMFCYCDNLTYVDVSDFDTSKVTDMYGMFAWCESLTAVDVSGFDTLNVTDMQLMFYYCVVLEKVDVSGFVTKNVTKMVDMFCHCETLEKIDVSGFDTSNVDDMTDMFNSCYNITTVDLSSFTTPKLRTMRWMFANSKRLTTIDLSSFDVANIENMDDIFYGCSSLILIVTPKNCKLDVELPKGRIWRDGKRNTYTKLPYKSVVLDSLLAFSITYDLNGGTNNKENPSIYPEGKTVKLKNPKRDGYTFGGWYDNPEFSGDVVATVLNESVTVYAKWIVNTYTITLNGNGGTFINDDGKATSVLKKNMTYDVEDIMGKPFNKEGYTFIGWTTQKDGKGSFYRAGDLIKNLTKTNKANVNLYAKWEANEYTVFFDINASEVYEGDLGGEMLPVTAKYGKSFKLPANKLTRKGYTFKGWSLTPDGNVKYKNKASVKNLAASENVTLYAVWSINTYSVKYNANGGKGKAPAAVKELQYGEKTFKTAVNPFTNKEYYTFKGWNTKKDGSGEFYDEDMDTNLVATKNKQAITLYATWEYEFSVAVNESEIASYPAYYNQSVTAEQIMEDIPELAKTGQYIAGFAISQKNADKGKMAYKGAVKNAPGKTLFPVYKTNKYTVKFDKNAPEGAKVSGKMNNISATYGKSFTLKANAFKCSGHTFKGWSTDKDATVAEFTNKAQITKNLSEKNKDVVVLYAIWE